IAVRPDSPSVGDTLLDGVYATAANATGFDSTNDRVVLDARAPILAGANASDIADRWIFSGNRPAVLQVEVAGSTVVRDGRHRDRDAVAARFHAVMAGLLATAGQDSSTA